MYRDAMMASTRWHCMFSEVLRNIQGVGLLKPCGYIMVSEVSFAGDSSTAVTPVQAIGSSVLTN